MQVVKLLNVIERTTKKHVEKEARVSFNRAWSTTQVKAIGERFHCNIQAICRANWVGDTGGNYIISTKT